ncbi:hypothetical protein GC169_07215 [bacterium]|nr:hypothetical protein [bacterium]
MSDADTIELRRYPSRKLYNPSTSSYIRLQDVADIVRKGGNIRVEDTETHEDVTRQVLLQIIMDQETQSDRAILSADVLADMIRLNQNRASEMMTALFEQTVSFIRQQQESVASQVSTSLPNPWAVFDPAQLAQMQRAYQERLVQMWGGGGAVKPRTQGDDAREHAATTKSAAAAAQSDADELDAMRARLDELEMRLKSR